MQYDKNHIPGFSNLVIYVVKVWSKQQLVLEKNILCGQSAQCEEELILSLVIVYQWIII